MPFLPFQIIVMVIFIEPITALSTIDAIVGILQTFKWQRGSFVFGFVCDFHYNGSTNGNEQKTTWQSKQRDVGRDCLHRDHREILETAFFTRRKLHVSVEASKYCHLENIDFIKQALKGVSCEEQLSSDERFFARELFRFFVSLPEKFIICAAWNKNSLGSGAIWNLINRDSKKNLFHNLVFFTEKQFFCLIILFVC